MMNQDRKRLSDLDSIAITASQGFLAMKVFLEAFYDRTHGTGDLLNILADIEVLDDGGSSDPAALSDWQESVEAARADRA